MRLLLLSLFLCTEMTLQAQRTIQTIVPQKPEVQITLSPKLASVFQAISLVVYSKTEVQISVSGTQKAIHADVHQFEETATGKQVFGPFYTDADAKEFQFQLWSEQTELPDSIHVHVYTPEKLAEPTETNFTENNVVCPLPPALLKSDWCTQTGGCAPVSSPVSTAVSHLIVHHSAGANTAASWSAVVNTIWDYHVNTNGWSDVGYNWLIAPNGKLYQGRADNMTGAHFCGQNSNTMGVCMLGTYTDTTITAAARETLVGLLAWKCNQRNIDPTKITMHGGSGLNLDNISGHKDGCATECPGETFHTTFPALRQLVATRVSDCIVSAITEPILAPAAISTTQGVWSYTLPESTVYPAQILICNALGQLITNRQVTEKSGIIGQNRGTGMFYYRVFSAGNELGNGSFFSGE
jgi:N-acetylmuramoyl-L-alanine amidase